MTVSPNFIVNKLSFIRTQCSSSVYGGSHVTIAELGGCIGDQQSIKYLLFGLLQKTFCKLLV